ncbi:DUF3987 domain-containing protein [Hymenobacter guriensis]|uniref:DUF3987 domain-containing protein n=1 Tax=Hymenobacter guriensis TaxID=2793065 RepID=A0ABS0KXI1_9BACT|nr:DUF3987 domain-containing protein [Hymenobacter guriensis]MBG8552578.1 DUF3987 domain-containing protein [Hymenobacter guriensis]
MLNLNDLEAATAPRNSEKLPPSDKSVASVADSAAVPAEALAWCLAQHEQHHGPLPGAGGRNSWLTALAYFCNERGVPVDDLLPVAESRWAQPDFTALEIRRTVLGIYRRESARHGCQPWQAARSLSPEPPATPPAPRRRQAAGSPPPLPLETPTIPAAVYAALPVFLQRCCAPFPTERERDVMLTGTLSILSGCFPQLQGLYDGATVGANLFSFTVAPAANGKGGLAWARRLAYPWHKALVQQSRQEQQEHELLLEQYQQQKRASKGKGPLPAAPEPPAFRQLYIPANSSAAGLIKALADNEGRGILCETEADTLSGALQQDWGNYSDLLRKAFHHEPYTYQRKTGREFYELERPQLSVALTGTPGQVQALIPTAEDGLFSRFLFYAFEAPHVWRDVSPAAGRGNLTAYFDELAQHVTQMIGAVTAPVVVQLTPGQWQQLNAAGTAWLAAAVAQTGEESGSVVKRLGLTAFRLALLLTLVRTFEYGEQPAQLTCEEADFTTALALADVYRAHALALFDRMPRPVLMSGRRAAKASQEVRVRELHAQGLSLREIEEQTGVPFNTARRWLQA